MGTSRCLNSSIRSIAIKTKLRVEIKTTMRIARGNFFIKVVFFRSAFVLFFTA